MPRTKLLVVEDHAEERQDLVHCLEELGYEVAGLATNLQDALGLYFTVNPDLVIIDIYLQGQPDGILLAEKIRQQAVVSKPFIFLTHAADRHTFAQAASTTPDSYLIKPYNPPEVQYAIELALSRFETQDQPLEIRQGMLFIKTGKTLHKVAPEEVLYIEVDGKHCQLSTASNRYLVQWPLKTLIEQLGSTRFVRVHRNYAVNWQQVVKVHLTDRELSMSNGQIIPMSQRLKDKVIDQLTVLA